MGHGHSENLAMGSVSTAEEKKIIVSRSHAGTVETVAKKSLGNVKITPAGGAGKNAALLFLEKKESDSMFTIVHTKTQRFFFIQCHVDKSTHCFMKYLILRVFSQ